jgi:hypothetical protein
LWGFLHVSGWFTPEDCWTVINVLHTIVTFTFFHWIKGSPQDVTQGDYNGFTLYEQIDAGVAYTNTKKFLMLIPALLCWIACHLGDYKPFINVINMGMFVLCIIPKVPEMHRVRILGLNKTTGIDDPVEDVRRTRSSERLRSVRKNR